MALLLKSVHAAHGARWVTQGLRLFAKKPLAFMSLLVMFMVAATVLSLVPGLGALLQMALLPLLSLGFMLAAAAVHGGGHAHPGHFVAPLRGSASKRRDLLILCGLFGALAVAIFLLANWVSNDAWLRLHQLLAKGQSGQLKVPALLEESGVQWGMLLATVLGSVLSVPFWHAPALVHLNGQSWQQALFSSSLALWRNRAAFIVYSLGWLLLMLAVTLVSALVLGLLQLPQLMGLLGLPIGLATSAAFYVSLIFCFNDCFANDANAAAKPAATRANQNP